MVKNNIRHIAVLIIFITAWASCQKKNGTTTLATGSQKSIKSFTFKQLSPALSAKVDTLAKTITISLPPATDPSNLTPYIELYNAQSTISPASQTPNNFITSTTYTVTGQDHSIDVYKVILQKPIASNKDVPTPPKYLCVYYDCPSKVNGSNGNINNAFNIFKKFDIIVLADVLRETNHSDHNNTITLINMLKAYNANIKIYGYIDVGVSGGSWIHNYTEAQLKQYIDEWQQVMGANGVFADDFGYDYGVTRSRQNFFIDYAHSKGLSVFANGWQIDDVLGGNNCHLSGAFDDYYLMESFLVSNGNYTSLEENIIKANKAYQYMKTTKVGIACLSTLATVNATANSLDQFKQCWYATAMYNFDAFQFTDILYSANNCTNPMLYFYPNPITNYGNSFTDFDWVRKASSTRYERSTNTTTLYITGNGATHGTGGVR